MELTPNESIFCQALAMTSLLGELNNSKFLESEYYQNLRFSGNSENFRKKTRHLHMKAGLNQ